MGLLCAYEVQGRFLQLCAVGFLRRGEHQRPNNNRSVSETGVSPFSLLAVYLKSFSL